METADVVVVGGGLAGVTVALDLAERGVSVVVVERSASLGGRAASHVHSEDGPIDVGQHVYLGCCEAYRSLLTRLGTLHLAPLSPRLNVMLVDGAQSTFSPARLRSIRAPHPLSLAVALMRYSHLTMRERLSAIGIVKKAERDWAYARDLLQSTTFAAWLAQTGATPNSREALWDPLIVATLNADCEHVSAEAGVMVLVKALLQGDEAASIGIPRAPLSELLRPMTRIISPTGRVKLGVTVEQVIPADQPMIDGSFDVILSDGGRIQSRAVVVATEFRHVEKLIARWHKHPFVRSLRQLGSNPIVNAHFWFDRPITSEPMLGFIRSPLQWLFDLTALYKTDPDHGPTYHHPPKRPQTDDQSNHVAVSISDASQWIDQPSRAIIDVMHREIKKLLPKAQGARLIKTTVRKMPHATLACPPGYQKHRPGNETPIPGLWIAGDYTNTGWPSTMESAVISGHRCAAQVLSWIQSDGRRPSTA